MTAFDQAKWSETIREPDWYLAMAPELKALRDQWESDPESNDQLKQDVRRFFETALEDGTLNLAQQGPDMDAERQPIDTIVIHHTSAEPGYRLPYMNAVQLLNVYVPYFSHPMPDDARLKGHPMWSGHFRDGKQVFYLYHWLMRMDGSTTRLLEDDQIGWHAGNWDVNCRSAAICLDNDYEKQDPNHETIGHLADFITETYPHIRPEQVMGHCEARSGTICPGTNFLSGWKPVLQQMIKERL